MILKVMKTKRNLISAFQRMFQKSLRQTIRENSKNGSRSCQMLVKLKIEGLLFSSKWSHPETFSWIFYKQFLREHLQNVALVVYKFLHI